MNQREKLRCVTQVAMLTAVLAVLSQIAFPMPSGVPLTLQTFAVALCADLGGLKKGFPALLIYLLLGAFGVPVFSHLRGGFGMLFGVTGGFLWGFLPLALLCAVGARLPHKAAALLLAALGTFLCHLCGLLQYMQLSGTGFRESVLLISLPYLCKDLISAAAAYAAALAVQRALRSNGIVL